MLRRTFTKWIHVLYESIIFSSLTFRKIALDRDVTGGFINEKNEIFYTGGAAIFETTTFPGLLT